MNLGFLPLTCYIFEAPLGTGHTIPHWRALRCGKDDTRGQSCGSTLNIHQDILKIGNLLHKWGYFDIQFGNTNRKMGFVDAN